jgi:hypothetical protein
VEFFYADEDEMRNDTLFFVLRCGVQPEKVSRLMEKRMKGDKKYAWAWAANDRPPISSWSGVTDFDWLPSMN